VALLEHTFRWRHTHSTQCIRASASRVYLSRKTWKTSRNSSTLYKTPSRQNYA